MRHFPDADQQPWPFPWDVSDCFCMLQIAEEKESVETMKGGMPIAELEAVDGSK